jgi:hypothetical protein
VVIIMKIGIAALTLVRGRAECRSSLIGNFLRHG